MILVALLDNGKPLQMQTQVLSFPLIMYYTMKQAADLLGISRARVHQLCADLPPEWQPEKVGRTFLLTQAHIDLWSGRCTKFGRKTNVERSTSSVRQHRSRTR